LKIVIIGSGFDPIERSQSFSLGTFEWLLAKVDLPGRPAQKRTHCEQKNYIMKNAA